jgi:hypothetical protein
MDAKNDSQAEQDHLEKQVGEAEAVYLMLERLEKPKDRDELALIQAEIDRFLEVRESCKKRL